jgi:hypothetical protein
VPESGSTTRQQQMTLTPGGQTSILIGAWAGADWSNAAAACEAVENP